MGGKCPACGAMLGRTASRNRRGAKRKKTQVLGTPGERTSRSTQATIAVGTPKELADREEPPGAPGPERPSGAANDTRSAVDADSEARGDRELDAHRELGTDPELRSDRELGTDPELNVHATRSARLPPAPPPEAPSSVPSSQAGSSEAEASGPGSSGATDALPPSGGSGGADQRAESSEPLSWRSERDGSARQVGTSRRADGSEWSDSTEPGMRVRRPTRPTLMNRISRLSMDVAGRTTFLELASIADRLTVETKSRVPPRFGFKVIVAGSLLATAVLVVTAALAIGYWRWLPVAFLFLSFTASIGWGVLRSLPRLAKRFGAREIPGRAAAWLTLGFATIAAASWGVTLTVSAAAEEVGRVAWPVIAPYMPERLVALEKKEPAPPPPPPPAPKEAPTKGKKVWVEPGVLFMPSTFEPRDGGFDLVLFFHGNPDIVEEAVPRAGINALIHVTNLGTGSAPYQSRFIVPDSLLALIAYIERETPKLGLPPGLTARRVALASWSAGYGALHSFMLDPDHLERVDAMLVLDGIHGGFRPNTERGVDPSTIAPFLAFADKAVKGERLMAITHSAIPTALYTSSTEAADALLRALDVERKEVEESRSPRPVKFKAAVQAFPITKRRWLRARTEAHKGELHVFGYAGDTKEDHIAHLAQMSVTVLPLLAARWGRPATP